MRRSLAVALPLALATSLALTADTAHAQLGKLKKMGADIAKEAGREAAGLPPKKEEAKVGSTAGSDDYTLTAERADLIIASMAPLVADAKREAAAKAVQAGYEERRKKQDACATAASRNVTMPSQAYMDNGGKVSERQGAVMMRMSAAMQAGKKREAAYLQDTAAVLSYELITLMSGAKCGPALYKPAALIESELARDANSGGEIGEDGRSTSKFEVPEPARKSLTTRQYGLMRERIAIYAIELARDGGNPTGFKSFSDGEHAVLGERANKLRELAPLFRDGQLRWATWGDIKSW